MAKNKYTCAEYREEMILVRLKNRLNRSDISEEEKQTLAEEIAKLEREMGLD